MKRERGPVTQPYGMAQVGWDSTALHSPTISIYLHCFYSAYCPMSLQGFTVSNARNCLLSSRDIHKTWMMELILLFIFLFNYTMLIK